jgi:hypothetical protein
VSGLAAGAAMARVAKRPRKTVESFILGWRLVFGLYSCVSTWYSERCKVELTVIAGGWAMYRSRFSKAFEVVDRN